MRLELHNVHAKASWLCCSAEEMLFLKLLPSLANNNHSASTHSWHFTACCWLFFCWSKSLWDCERYSSSLSFHFCRCETAHGAQQPSHNMLFACPNRKAVLNSPNGSPAPNVSHFLLNVRGGQQLSGGVWGICGGVIGCASCVFPGKKHMKLRHNPVASHKMYLSTSVYVHTCTYTHERSSNNWHSL